MKHDSLRHFPFYIYFKFWPPADNQMMRKPGSNKFRAQAPLASFESFLSLETEEREESREMRELHWNFNNNNINSQQTQPQRSQLAREEKTIDEPWLHSDFCHMTRKQQNCEIYRVSLPES